MVTLMNYYACSDFQALLLITINSECASPTACPRGICTYENAKREQ